MRVALDEERGVFMISVAAELAHMHPQTLRMYEARGLIQPKRSPKNTRLYSQRDVELLRRIQQMTAEGLNLAGVEKVLSAGERERLAGELEGKVEELMQPDRFTVKSQEAVAAAQQLAAARRNPEVAPAHLLVALLVQEDGLVVPILQKVGADPAAVGARADEAVEALPKLSDEAAESRGRPPPWPQTLRQAEKEMAKLGDEYISTEHLLLALTDKASGVAEILPDRDSLEKAIAEVRGPHRVTSPNPEDSVQALEKFGRDLTAEAEARQARPGDRPRRGDPPRDPGPLPPHQEQPGADRRPRRRQDRDRRGPGAADRRRRRAGEPARPPRDRARHRLAAGRLQIPRASSRSG